MTVPEKPGGLPPLAGATGPGVRELRESGDREGLIRVLLTGEPAARLYAARALGELVAADMEGGGAPDPRGLAALLCTLYAGLDEAYWAVWRWEPERLKRLPPPPDPEDKYTIWESLSAEREERRAEALGLYGAGAAPGLAGFLADGSLPTQTHILVARALEGIGGAAAEAVPALTGAMASDSEWLRTAAAKALGTMGPAAAEAVPALLGAMASESAKLRIAALKALGSIGPAAGEAIPAVVACLEGDESWVLRGLAAKTLGEIGRKAAYRVVPALVAALADVDYPVRSDAAEALGRLGRGAATAAPALLRAMLEDGEGWVRSKAAEALPSLGPDGASILIRAFEDSSLSRYDRARLAGVLSRMGPVSGVVGALTRAVRDPDLRPAAIEGLARLGPEAVEAAPALIDALSDESYSVRDLAAKALGKIGPGARAAVPALIEQLGRLYEARWTLQCVAGVPMSVTSSFTKSDWERWWEEEGRPGEGELQGGELSDQEGKMGEPVPLEYGTTYHIYGRGVDGGTLFFQEGDYYTFLELYGRHVGPVADTFAYCLLPDHFHLLVRIKEREELSGLSKLLGVAPDMCFSNLFDDYTKAASKVYGRSGALFQRPFGRSRVTEDAYFARLVVYIHHNPQKHGLIDDYRDWVYSSYGALAGSRGTQLRRDEVLGWFGGREGMLRAHEELMPALLAEDFE
jgi:putative transposase